MLRSEAPVSSCHPASPALVRMTLHGGAASISVVITIERATVNNSSFWSHRQGSGEGQSLAEQLQAMCARAPAGSHLLNPQFISYLSAGQVCSW